jgi:hypothetical protein
MLKVFEYMCPNDKCSVFEKVHERFLHSGQENSQICFECHAEVLKVYSATKGYVKGTQNPCKC